MKRRIWLSVFVLVIVGLSNNEVFAQQNETDSLQNHSLEEVVVTATRNERTVGALPMPVTLIKKDLIKTMGSVRLNDILTEQTGLVVVPQVNGQGSGIQIQGFSPDYTLILIDGEPIIGRYTGSLELSRLTVGNIKQVEIVKGPSSSLYGSDALAGVINIITERPKSNQGDLSLRYGANNTLDLNSSGSLIHKNLGVYLFANRYSTDGYDLSPQNYGKTVSPFSNVTLGSRITYKLGIKTDLSIGGRYFDEKQEYSFDVLTNGNSVRTHGDGSVKDWNFSPTITHRLTSHLKTTGRFYTTRYSTNTQLRRTPDDSITYRDNFNQAFTRYELNGEYFFDEQNILTVGTGHIDELVSTSRYNDQLERKQQTDYAFFQHEWMPLRELTIIAGGRYDHNSIYGGQLSPKLSARFEINKRISFKGSFGFGFKSPDFRQLYLNFNNKAGGGYSVLGTEIVREKLAEFQAQGLIQMYLFDPSLLGKLQAESSVSINIGGRAAVIPKLILDLNFFRNTIDNLIEYQPVAINTSGQSIYSYRNIKHVLMQGLEMDFTYPFTDKLSISLGYQLLYAKDRDVIENIENGGDLSYYTNPETHISGKLKACDYFGLYNRSRHTGNFKMLYSDKKSGLSGSLRVIYRGKFGIGGIRGNIQGEIVPSSDTDNNTILDSYDNFIPGYALVNFSLAKEINKILRFQIGVDNLFDYTQPIFIPNLPGRLVYLSASFSIK